MRRERGAVLIESAIVLPMLLILAIGLSEAGLALYDWLAVSNATREGARIGASAGDLVDGSTTADTLILDAVAQASCALRNGEVTQVRVYKSNSSGAMIGSSQNVYTLNSVNCATLTASWTTNTYNWDPSTRDNTLDDLDTLGLEVSFEHLSLTGLFTMFEGIRTDRAWMRLDPDTSG
ncbi:MAG: pilus assembly protein [Actinobacteria bacterium]|nr:pilus assembly protein [Actinomycetota bacterium]